MRSRRGEPGAPLVDDFACDGGCGRDVRSADARPVDSLYVSCARGNRAGAAAKPFLRFCRHCAATNGALLGASRDFFTVAPPRPSPPVPSGAAADCGARVGGAARCASPLPCPIHGWPTLAAKAPAPRRRGGGG